MQGFEQHAMLEPVSEIMRPAVTCRMETSIRGVLRTLDEKKIGSVLLVDERNTLAGIFTLPDLLRRVAVAGRDFDAPISTVMSRDPVTIPSHAPLFEAALIMQQHHVRHMPVVDRGEIKGVVSERDLFHLQGIGVQRVSEALANAADVDRLRQLSQDIRRLGSSMLAQGVSVEQISNIISRLNDQLTQRLIDLTCNTEIDFCWVALGSEGRCEQTLSSDQDNAIVFASPKSDDETRNALLPYARRINEALADFGFPLCKGDIMAGNPRWCLSLAEWKAKFASWIDHGDPESLLRAAIFFDFRGVHRSLHLVHQLRDWLTAHAKKNPRFLHQMAGNAMRNRVPLSLLRRFELRQSEPHARTIDIKIGGTALFADAARIYSLQTGVSATNTEERLRLSGEALDFVRLEIEAWIAAFHFIRRLRMLNESRGADAGHYLRPHHLNAFDRAGLRQALLHAKNLQSRLASDYQV
jgi:CBS domain-containing protein